MPALPNSFNSAIMSMFALMHKVFRSMLLTLSIMFTYCDFM